MERTRRGDSFPEFLYEDFPKFDVGLYGYNTLFKSHHDLTKEAEVFEGLIRDSAYETIILIGHSEGGLLCLATICDLINSCQEKVLSRVGGLILMATPQAGSQRVPALLARFSYDLTALDPRGDLVLEIHRTLQNHLTIVFNEERQRPGDTVIPTWAVLGVDDHWVTDLSARLDLPDSRIKNVHGSHTSIVKPQNKHDDAYGYVHDRIEDVWRRRRRSSNDPLGVHTIVTENIGLRFRQGANDLPIYPLADAEQAFPDRGEAFGVIEMRREPFEIFLDRRTWQTPNDDYPALQITVSDNSYLFKLANFHNPSEDVKNDTEVDIWLKSMPFFWSATGLADANTGSGQLFAVTDMSATPFGHNYIIGRRFNQPEANFLGIYVSSITDEKGRNLLKTAANIYMVFHLHNELEEGPPYTRIDPSNVDLVRINLVD